MDVGDDGFWVAFGGWPANGVLPTPPGGASPGGAQPKKRRRVVKKDPNKPTPKPWDEAEIKRLKDMVHKEGPGNWDSKALRLGSVRPPRCSPALPKRNAQLG